MSPSLGPKSIGSPGKSPVVVPGAGGAVVVLGAAVVVGAPVVVVVLGAGVVLGSAAVVLTGIVVVDVDPASSPAQATRTRPASKTARIMFVLMPPRFFMQVDRRRAGL
jgi:hypothetical protein